MSSDLAVSVAGVSKAYRIAAGKTRSTTLGEAISARLRHPFQRAAHREFRALDNVSFEVERGEVLGVIGRNGAGKSTLLKVLSRVTAPSAGRVDIWGRVGSLLEVGTGFHPELTGRENIFLNGAVLGMRRAEIVRRFDEIVDFARVQSFLDTPIKRYSSGMYVRLAFSVAAHLDTDVLLVDEVLAVGDSEFQRRCLGAMEEAAASGRTVLFVSHQMDFVRQLCSRGLVLDQGKVVYDGSPIDAIGHYRRMATPTSAEEQQASGRRVVGSGEYVIEAVQPTQREYEGGEAPSFSITIRREDHAAGAVFMSCHIVDASGATVLQCDGRLVGHVVPAADEYRCLVKVTRPWLKPGRYSFDVFLHYHGRIDEWEGACEFEVVGLPFQHVADESSTALGTVLPDFTISSDQFALGAEIGSPGV